MTVKSTLAKIKNHIKTHPADYIFLGSTTLLTAANLAMLVRFKQTDIPEGTGIMVTDADWTRTPEQWATECFKINDVHYTLIPTDCPDIHN
jgi:hypothetical protein